MRPLLSRLSASLDLNSPKSRLLPMEGMRGVAVTLVFFVHYVSLFQRWLLAGTPSDVLAYALKMTGPAGVDLFFIISGYLIYGAIIRTAVSYREFAARRLRRIYPTFLAVFGLYVVLSFMVPGESKLPPALSDRIIYLLENVMLLPGIFPLVPMITVAWSLSYELFFYLSVPLVGAALKLRDRSPKLRIAALCGFIALCFLTSLYPGHAYVRFVAFAVGGLCFEVARFKPKLDSKFGSALMWTLALTSLPVAYVIRVAGHLPFNAHVIDILQVSWVSTAFGLPCLWAFCGVGRLSKGLTFLPLRGLGNMSYSYYLLHGLVLKALAAVSMKLVVGQSAIFFWAMMAASYVATVTVSYMLYQLVEKPFSLAAPRPVPVAVPVVAGLTDPRS